MTHSDDDDITIITSLNTMDLVDGEQNTAVPNLRTSGSTPQFHIYSNGVGNRDSRLPDSVHALNVAYASLKERFNDLQRRHIDLEQKMQSQSRGNRQMQDGLDYPDSCWTEGSQSPLDFNSSAMSTNHHRAYGGLIAHGASSSDPTGELKQVNENLERKMGDLKRELWEKQTECESLKTKLKDMEDICEQFASSANGQAESEQTEIKVPLETERNESDDRDEENEESETTTELTEKYADMMRQIMGELSLSKRTIEQQQTMIENLQASGIQAPSSGSSGGPSESWVRLEEPTVAGARPKAAAPSRPIEPVQCSDNEVSPRFCFTTQVDANERNGSASGSASASGRDSAIPHRYRPEIPSRSTILDEIADSTHSVPLDVTPVLLPSKTPRPKSVTAPINVTNYHPGHPRVGPAKSRSFSSSTAQDNSGFESTTAEWGSSADRNSRRFSSRSSRMESDSAESALQPNRHDVFGRPYRDYENSKDARNLFSDNCDELYGNDTLGMDAPQMSRRMAELRRRQSDRDVRGPSHAHEAVRQSWPISTSSSSSASRQPPEGAAEIENRYRLNDGPRAPRPLNIDRNVDMVAQSRSYDNARNVNLLTDSSDSSEDEIKRETHQYGVLNNDPLASSKPVPTRNIYRERSDLTVKLPPVQSEHVEESKTCPVCNQNFPTAYAQADFEAHVVSCLNSDGERVCPVCNRLFASSVPQPEFEQHVNAHFEEEQAFEVINTDTNFGGPEGSQLTP